MTAPYVPLMRLYQNWLRDERGLRFDDYEALRRWSVTDTEAFWQSLWDHDGFTSPTPHRAVISGGAMPGVRWFEGAQVNYAQRVLRHVQAAEAAGVPAIVSDNEQGQAREMRWPELQRQVGLLAAHLQRLGVQPGDCVAAYLPNVPETVVAFLACASVGAVWSVCAPDMGAPAVLDRFRQIEPKVLIAVDGVYYAGRAQDRAEVVAGLRAGLPSVQTLIVLESGHAARQLEAEARFVDLVDAAAHATLAHGQGEPRGEAGSGIEPASPVESLPSASPLAPQWLPFDHPLWIVYSSGTTGLPKALVHGHGGVMLMAAAGRKHGDIGCSYHPNSLGERYHWYSSTGWIMWNSQIAGLLDGATICLFDGSPGGSKEQPDWSVLWRFAAKHRVTYFGAGAAFYGNCMKAGVDLAACGDLRRIRVLGSTGSPLPEDVQRWGTEQFARIGTPDIWWNNLSGGTDFAGVFIGGHRELPQTPGRLQCRQLGCAVEAWNEQGEPVTDEVGELVCTKPLPSMPLYLWGDDGNARYLSSYFDVYPGVWRHGDWLRILPDGSCIIYGRSDATINRHGLRLGTSEIYNAVEALPEVLDSMVIDLEYLGRDSRLLMFVALREGYALDAALHGKLRDAIKAAVSPRFLPDEILQAPEIPRTLSGKKQEVPIRKLFLGHPVDKVINREAMANPQCLGWYVAQAGAQGG